jgi:hypothetical protein
VVIELAGDAGFSRDLAAGGVFVPDCGLRLAQECDLVVIGANHQLVLPARVVYVDHQRGAGLELIGFSAEMKAQLAELEPVAPSGLEFLEEPAIDESLPDRSPLDDPPVADDELVGRFSEPVPLIDLEALDDDGEDDLAVPVAADPDADTSANELPGDAGAEAASDDATAAYDRAAVYDGVLGNLADFDPANPDHAYLMSAKTLPPDNVAGYDGPDDGPEGDPEHGPEDASRPPEPGRTTRTIARNVHERLRGLTLVAQLKLAVSGELHERIMLERLYGKNVWETLLRNPRLTAPEVARIARYGSLPRVLLEQIVGNNAWLQVPEVRRALLSNPRLGTDQIMKVLRLTPKHELKLAAIQTAYPHAVRNAAKMLLRGD